MFRGPEGKIPKFQISVISELYIEIWFLLSDWSLSGTQNTLGAEFEHSCECMFRKFTHRNEKYQIECCIFLGMHNFRFFMISGHLRASSGSFSAISARSCAKQMMKKVVRSTLLHLSCSGVPKGKIPKFQIFCDFCTLHWNLISVIKCKS